MSSIFDRIDLTKSVPSLLFRLVDTYDLIVTIIHASFAITSTHHLPLLRPLLPRRLTELPLLLGQIFQADHLSHRKVLLVVTEEILPVSHLLPHLAQRHPPILLPPNLPLPTAQLLVFLLILKGDEHLLHTRKVMREVLLETARHKRTSCIPAREEVVAAARAVDEPVSGDVEDGAVDGDVDGEGGVGAVVEGELVWC